MEALTSKFNKALQTPRVRRLRHDFDTLLVCARRPPAMERQRAPARVRRLELREDYADGGVPLARMLDEGRLVGSDDEGVWETTAR